MTYLCKFFQEGNAHELSIPTQIFLFVPKHGVRVLQQRGRKEETHEIYAVSEPARARERDEVGAGVAEREGRVGEEMDE